MAKVLSTSSGIGKTTKNNAPPKGKPNIGPGSTAGSRGTGATQKPTGPKTATQFNFNAGTMSNKAAGTSKNKSVPARGVGAGLPKASGAMPKFGGK
jgi:hypothetical protein